MSEKPVPQNTKQPAPPTAQPVAKQKRGQVVAHATLVEQYHEGPLPPPDMLARYEQILPGAAERVFKMAEVEQQHRHGIDRENIDREKSQDRRIAILYGMGQLSGILLGLVGIILGAWLCYNDKNVAGFGIFLGSLGTLIGVFIYQRKRAKADEKETENKQKVADKAKEP